MSTRFTEGGAGGGATTIGGLNDVSTSNVQPNEILKYNSTSGAWENAALNITGGLTYKGDLDATNPPDLSNASQGDFYVISVAGTRFGFDWEVRDHLLVNEDMGGTETDSKIDKVDNTEPAIFADNVNLAPTLQGNGLTVDVSGGTGSSSRLKVVESQLDNATIQNGAGYITGISGEDLTDLSNVSASGASAANNALVYNTTTSVWEAAPFPSAPVDSVNGQTGVVSLDTDDIAEGSTNEYFTNTKADARIAAADLTDLNNVSASGASAANNALVYNTTTSVWEAAPFPSGGGRSFSSVTREGANAVLATNSFYTVSADNITLKIPAHSGLSDGDEILIYSEGTVSSPRTFTLEVDQGIGSAGLQKHGEGAFFIGTSGGTRSFTLSSSILTLVYDSSVTRFYLHYNGSAAFFDVGTASGEIPQLTATGLPAVSGEALTNLDISVDQTPQLGGDLDIQARIITTSTTDGSIGLEPDGTGAVVARGTGAGNTPGTIAFNCEQNSHAIKIQSPAHGTYTDYTLKLPTGVGTPNQVLTSDGNNPAQLSWTTVSGSGASRPDVDTSLDHVGSPHSLTAPASTSTLEEIYIVDSSNGAVTINLPAVVTALEGFKYNIKRVGAGNNVVISPDGTTDKIEGSTNDQTLSVDYSALTLVCDGVDGWYII